MQKYLAALGLLLFCSGNAYAVCPSTLQIKDNLAVTGNAKYLDDGSGNCVPAVAPGLGGATPGNEIAPANTTGVNLKASAGIVWSIQLGGIAGPAYLKLYDKATAPTCGTDVPVKRLIIPVAATSTQGAGSNVTFPAGIKFSNGIGYCVTLGITDADTTAPIANNYLINIDFN